MENDEIKNFYNSHFRFWLKNERIVVRNRYLSLLGDVKNKKILDIGCGVGIDADILARKKCKGVGIDFSKAMVSECRKKKIPDWRFVNTSLINFETLVRFDAALFSMVIMHLEDLQITFKKIRSFLKSSSKLVLITNNPYLVAQQYGLHYREEISYTHHLNDLKVKKFHRPLNKYITEAKTGGFQLSSIEEIYGAKKDSVAFNSKNSLNFPDFIALVFKSI